ncbi:hypothetical protein M408DRAFT_293279 [Serendipita vermifera MAFF 305830]|uniref:Uncharacterized protein n=1 Tax=Serendipita vermifera MAFF 305830 TaxID=933852 RepID=A0A0C3ASD0_SERVB|nr:hypothetical protein M408DRAFT_293279 [Serendipita vermifera MAFF 305830]
MLRFFTYSAVINNLIAAMCCMWSMQMYSDLPERAQQLPLRDENSWPARVSRGEYLTQELILDVSTSILEEFGIYKAHSWISLGELLWTVLGLLCTFLTFTIYLWLTQSRAIAGALMMFAVPGFFGLGFPFISMLLQAAEWDKPVSALKKSSTFVSKQDSTRRINDVA